MRCQIKTNGYFTFRDIILIEEQSRAQESLKRRMDKLKDSIQKANQAVEIERQKNVDLLNLIFPANVARMLWLGKPVEARQYDEVTMLFSDIVGFTAICSTASPMAVINMLNELYTQFDVFCGEIDVYKVGLSALTDWCQLLIGMIGVDRRKPSAMLIVSHLVCITLRPITPC